MSGAVGGSSAIDDDRPTSEAGRELLDVRDLSVVYRRLGLPGTTTTKVAAQDVSLSIKESEIVGLVGESGPASRPPGWLSRVSSSLPPARSGSWGTRRWAVPGAGSGWRAPRSR